MAAGYLLAGAGLNLLQTAITAPERRERYANAEADFNMAKTKYMNQDLSNPNLNMENAYDNLTVNTQQADFVANNQNQGLSNSLNSLNAAAGGSGIAGLAQAMANQQNQNMIQASSTIGQQEARNQTLSAKGDMSIQNAERQGDMISRGLKRNQYATEYGIAQNELGQARAEKAAAIDQNFQAFGQGISGGFNYMENMTNAFGTDNLLGKHMTGFFGTPVGKTGGGKYEG